MQRTLNSFKSLSIIVPVVTETKSFIETIDLIFRVCDMEDLKEIIICPAYFASPECIQTAKDLCEKYRDFPISILMQNGPFEDLIIELFKTVTGSHFIFQPADLEQNPRMLPFYIEKSRNHPDAVITGSRFLSKKGVEGLSKIKKIFYKMFHVFFRMLYSVELTDTTYLIWMMPTERVKRLVLKEKSYAVMYEAFLKILRSGTEVIEIPVKFQKHSEEKLKARFYKDGLRYLLAFFRVRFANTSGFYEQKNKIEDL